MKNFRTPPRYSFQSIPGQIPDDGSRKLMKLAEQKPLPPGQQTLAHRVGPRPTASSVFDNLGLDLAVQTTWVRFLEGEVATAVNEVTFRQALTSKLLESDMAPELRKVIYDRAMVHYKQRFQKSYREVLTPDQILEKAEARGGTYYKRVPTSKSGGKTKWRYFYNKEDYEGRDDAHRSGEEESHKYILSKVQKAVAASGKAGCDVKSFKSLAKRYGAKSVAAALKSGDGFEFKKGKFYPVQKKDEVENKPMKKSLQRPTFIIRGK